MERKHEHVFSRGYWIENCFYHGMILIITIINLLQLE